VSEVRRPLRLVSSAEAPTTVSQLQPASQPITPVAHRDLARRLAHIDLVSIDTAVWRHMSRREHSRPDSGDGAIGTGGRFNPPGSFPVIYGSLSRTAAGTEFRSMARRHPIGIENLLPRHLYRFRVKSSSALDLRLPAVREALDLPDMGSAACHLAYTQLLGEVARALRIDLIVAPGVCTGHAMAAIFPELVPRSYWEFCHMGIWISMSDVPGVSDLAPISLEDRMIM
jgi:RES domain-containing protein